MTAEYINMFTNFLSSYGIYGDYAKYYDDHNTDCRDKSKPVDIEIHDFLSRVSEKQVFRSGFDAENNSMASFWKDAESLWLEEIKTHLPSKINGSADAANSPSQEPQQPASGWKYCLKCQQVKPVNEFTFKASDNMRHCYCHTCMSSKYDVNAPVLSAYECVISDQRIYLNNTLTDLLVEKDFNHCGLRHENHKIFMIFCHVDRHKNLRKLKYGGISLNDETIFDDVCRYFSIAPNQVYHLHISQNLSKKNTAVTVEILRCLSHDDYLEKPFVFKEAKPEVKKEVAKEPAVEQLVELNRIFGSNESLTENISKPQQSILKDNEIAVWYGNSHRVVTSLTSREEIASFLSRLPGKYDYPMLFFHSCLFLLPNDEIKRILLDLYRSLEPDRQETCQTLLATLLKKEGWKLQKPVKVIKYEDF